MYKKVKWSGVKPFTCSIFYELSRFIKWRCSLSKSLHEFIYKFRCVSVFELTDIQVHHHHHHHDHHPHSEICNKIFTFHKVLFTHCRTIFRRFFIHPQQFYSNEVTMMLMMMVAVGWIRVKWLRNLYGHNVYNAMLKWEPNGCNCTVCDQSALQYSVRLHKRTLRHARTHSHNTITK